MSQIPSLLFCLVCMNGLFGASTSQKLLFILLDGFRWDILNTPEWMSQLPNLNKLLTQGSSVDRLIPGYQSSSYGNHWTLMTGVYADVHGIFTNEMYKVVDDQVTMLDKFGDELYQQVEPIWATARREGHETYLYNWPWCRSRFSSQGDYPVQRCMGYQAYAGPRQFRNNLRWGLQKLSLNKCNISVVYFDEPDLTAHKYGPRSKQELRMLKRIDSALGYMFNRRSYKQLKERLTIMISSDHGMEFVEKKGIVLARGKYNPDDLIHVTKDPAAWFLWPKPDKINKTIEDFGRIHPSVLTVYKREELPEELHIKRSRYMSPLVVSVKEKYLLLQNPTDNRWTGSFVHGVHGYLPKVPSMATVFLAMGPDFKAGARISSIENVNVYQLMCHVIGINGNANNGSWSLVSPLLRDDIIFI